MIFIAKEILYIHNSSQNAPKSQNDMEFFLDQIGAHFGRCVADAGHFFGHGLSN